MKELHLHGGRIALVSDVDYERCRQHKWHVNEQTASGKPYVRSTINDKTVYLHRFITNCPPSLRVDHKSKDTFDNRRPNLRVTSFEHNNYNRTGWSLSGLKGVSQDRSKFRARITFQGETISIGVFATPIEAARAYDEAALRLFGEFAHLNYPDDHPVDPGEFEPATEIPF